MNPADLHLVTVISNPVRYQSRGRLLRRYLEHAERLGATQWVIEATFGCRPPEVADPANPRHIVVRCDDELWVKESLINRAVQALPEDWRYMAWVDGDIEFLRPNWAAEVLHALQHHKVVQTWSHAVDLGPLTETIGTAVSFMQRIYDGQAITAKYAGQFHPGYSWAWRREAWDAVGGMIDHGIVGSGDRHMATALIGKPELGYHGAVHPNYVRLIDEWAARAAREIRRDVGVVPGTVLHSFHGWKPDRKYADRWKILVDNAFDPMADIIRNSHGVLTLAGNKPKLRDDLRRYFRARKEDAC